MDVGLTVEFNHVKYYVLFIFHVCGLCLIKLLCTWYFNSFLFCVWILTASSGQGNVTLKDATNIASLESMLTPDNVFGLAVIIIVILLSTVATNVESLLFATIFTVLCNEIKANNSLELYNHGA